MIVLILECRSGIAELELEVEFGAVKLSWNSDCKDER
jgi:hypothetical protein